jgi:TnpA family transposase
VKHFTSKFQSKKYYSKLCEICAHTKNFHFLLAHVLFMIFNLVVYYFNCHFRYISRSTSKKHNLIDFETCMRRKIVNSNHQKTKHTRKSYSLQFVHIIKSEFLFEYCRQCGFIFSIWKTDNKSFVRIQKKRIIFMLNKQKRWSKIHQQMFM